MQNKMQKNFPFATAIFDSSNQLLHPIYQKNKLKKRKLNKNITTTLTKYYKVNKISFP